MAVLRTAAGLERDDALDLDLRSAPPHPDVVGHLQQFGESLVGKPQHLEHLVAVERLATFENLGARDVEDIGRRRVRRRLRRRSVERRIYGCLCHA